MTRKSSDEIADRVRRVRDRMGEAALRAGRSPEGITLLGVTKTQSVQAVRELLRAGVVEIGENRVQELLEKEPYLEDIPHKTHLIGNLQRNKAKFLPGHIDIFQSLDSVKTLEALEKAYSGFEEKLDVLIEVNIGEETTKSGIGPRGLDELWERVCRSDTLCIRGLMAIPPFGLGEKIRPHFAQMRQLFIDMKAKKMDNDTVNILSIGMSADYEIAIEEGATMVRVGTELFGPR